MLLDRFGQPNKFWKKSYKKWWNIQVWVLWRSSRRHTEKSPGFARNQPSFQGHLLNVRLGLLLDAISGRLEDFRLGRSGRSNMIFRGRPRDVLETNICRLGKFRKSREYTATVLSINQNLDSKVIAVTDTDRLETMSQSPYSKISKRKKRTGSWS